MPTDEEIAAQQAAAEAAAAEREAEHAKLLKERDDAAAERDRIRQEAAAREQQWQEHVARMAQAQQQPQQQQPQDPFGDDDIMTGKQFKLAAANLMSTLAGATQQEIHKIHRTQRAANREHAKARLPNFDKYAKDIEEYLDKVPPEVASNPAVYDEAYKLARAKYVDDDVAAGTEAAALARTRELLESKGLDPADFGLDDAAASPTTPAATVPSHRTVEPPASPGNASRGAVSIRTDRKPTVRLNQQQSYAAGRFGISADEFVRYSNDDEEFDFLGSKGRQRF